SVLRRLKLIVRPARDDGNLELGDGSLVEDGAQRARAQDIGFEGQDLVRRNDGAADRVRELLRLRPVDISDRQSGAFCGRMERGAGGDAACPLERDVDPVQTVLAERSLYRRLDTEKHAER